MDIIIHNDSGLVFTDPVLKVYDNPKKERKHPFDVCFYSTWKCNSSERIPFVRGTKICATCYINNLLWTMNSVPRFKRPVFLEYQMSQHEEPECWLKEVDIMLFEYEDELMEELGDRFVTDYRQAIEKLREPLPVQFETDREVNYEMVYQLPENFHLKENGVKSERLDRAQSAILFHYLRKSKAVVNYTDTDLAKITHYLTGHSEQNLRTTLSPGKVAEAMKADRKGEEQYNLKAVKAYLEEMLEMVEKDLRKTS